MADTLIALTKEMTQETLEQVELFRIRFQELWNNWESLKGHGLSLDGRFLNLGDGKVSGPGCGVETHRLKGLYLDFRFFWAQKEPTEFFRISKILGKHCVDDRLYRCLSSNTKQWKEAGLLNEWHGIKPDDMIDTLFNGELFHSDPIKKERVRHVQGLMSNDLAHRCLVYSVYERMLVIRNINWIVRPLNQLTQHVRVPAEYA